MADTVLVDFDGTLCDTDPILHLFGDWDNFHAASFDCPERAGVVELVKRLQLICKVIVVTGKGERFRAKMVNWLSFRGIMPDEILMRPEGSMLSDAELKPTLLDQLIGPCWKDDVICAIEDRDKMVDAWRALGVTCLQAAPCIEQRSKELQNAAE